MIEFSYNLPNLPIFDHQISHFSFRSAESNNFNLFNLLAQSLTVNIQAFQNKPKNFSNQVQIIHQALLAKQSSLTPNESSDDNQKTHSQPEKLEEKTILQFQNSIQKSTQNINDQESQVFLTSSINPSIQSDQAPCVNNGSFINFEASCPKIGLGIHEILQKKERILSQQVSDWNKSVKRCKNMCSDYQTRQVRMLFK